MVMPLAKESCDYLYCLYLKHNVPLNYSVCDSLHCSKAPKTEEQLNNTREAQNGNMFANWSYDGKMVYENIIEATEEFDSKHCVGVGGCGSVYKVELQLGQVVAVKKFHSI